MLAPHRCRGNSKIKMGTSLDHIHTHSRTRAHACAHTRSHTPTRRRPTPPSHQSAHAHIGTLRSPLALGLNTASHSIARERTLWTDQSRLLSVLTLSLVTWHGMVCAEAECCAWSVHSKWERTDRHGVDLAVNSHNRARLLACGKPCYAPWATMRSMLTERRQRRWSTSQSRSSTRFTRAD